MSLVPIEAGAKLFSKTGDNELRYRNAAHPPIVSGSLTPVAKLVRTMNEVPTGFVRVLAAVRDQKEKQAA